MGSLPRHNLEGQGLQGVAGQDGSSFIERLVGRGPTPAQVVVVHAGQVIMDQTVGMDQFQGASGADHALPIQLHQFAGLQDEEGAQTFAWRKSRIAHRLSEAASRRQQDVQRGIHARGSLRELISKGHDEPS